MFGLASRRRHWLLMLTSIGLTSVALSGAWKTHRWLYLKSWRERFASPYPSCSFHLRRERRHHSR